MLTLPLPNDNDLSAVTKACLATLPPLNVFRMFGHLPNSLPAFIDLAKSFLENSSHSFRIREIAILRVAYLTRSPYEWHQHELLGKTAGLKDTEIETIRSENPVSNLSNEENFICQIADELTLACNLSDASFKQLFATYNKQAGCELILMISFYNMLSRFLGGTRVQIEESNPLEGRSSPTG